MSYVDVQDSFVLLSVVQGGCMLLRGVICYSGGVYGSSLGLSDEENDDGNSGH